MSELVPNFVLLLLHLSYEIKTFSKINNHLFFSWVHFMYFLVVVLVKLTEEYMYQIRYEQKYAFMINVVKMAFEFEHEFSMNTNKLNQYK